MFSDLLVALRDVFNIVGTLSVPAVQVIVCMVSDFMSGIYYLFKHNGMLSDIVTDTKKCCFNIVALQCFQNKFCRARHRPVIKSQK